MSMTMVRRSVSPKSFYKLESVTRACTILHLFEDDQRALALTDMWRAPDSSEPSVFVYCEPWRTKGCCAKVSGASMRPTFESFAVSVSGSDTPLSLTIPFAARSREDYDGLPQPGPSTLLKSRIGSNLCVAVSQGGSPEARRELRLPNARLVAAVAFFPEKYGESLILLALGILNKRTPPPAIYMPVQVLTRRNVDEFYPQDTFVGLGEGSVS